MKPLKSLLPLIAAALVVGCSDPAPEDEDARAVPVTAAEVRVADVEVIERTVGRIESAVAPTVAAEVAGRVVEVLHDAGDRVTAGTVLARIDDTNYRNALLQARAALARLDALRAQQERTVERYRRLVANDSASQSLLDAAIAELESLEAQRVDARSRIEVADRAARNTEITAPVDGTVERRMVSEGDFRGVGDALFRLATDTRLRVSLPFPERLAARLEVGQSVLLQPQTGGTAVRTTISELRPTVGQSSRAVDAIADLENPGGWRAGGSVTATVVLAVREGQVLVPAQAVVQRPRGTVAYVVDGNLARERSVEVGVRQNGDVEILSGLERGERVVVDGAGFLTDGARIAIRTN